jgi:Cof subfamily protein (haloacid dehalogenase superfamily)
MESGEMKNVKLIVTDLDNTLLRRDKTISDYTTDVFRCVRERGIKIAFASARPKRTILPFGESVPMDVVICCNGSSVYIGNEKLCSFGIPIEVAESILVGLANEYPDLRLYTEIADRNYANNDHSAYISGVGTGFYTQTDFTDLPRTPADKVGAILENEPLTVFDKYLTDKIYIQVGSLLYGGDGKLVNILSRAASKQNCIIELSKHYGISSNEVAAFGDDFNDVEMLRECGVGVAMSNAIPECKAVAGYICGDCDEDGVAHWIEENLL